MNKVKLSPCLIKQHAIKQDCTTR